jgi:hypothetical protein
MIKRQGDFVMQETFVEELAMKWYERQTGEFLGKFFTDIAAIGMSKQLGERLVELSQKESGGDIIKVVTGNSGIFDYNFVNTSQGSRLILSLAEIAPAETINSLTKSFKDKTTEELTKFDKGRRNLVWALEKLCFRLETFSPAARLLYRLALAENENIGNNATGQFLQLFQPMLAGTEVDLMTRLNLLKQLNEELNNGE